MINGIQVLIYICIGVCCATMGFNVVCNFTLNHTNKQIANRNIKLKQEIRNVITNNKGAADKKHCRFICKKFKRPTNLIYFDEELNALAEDYPSEIKNYLNSIYPVFVSLALTMLKKDDETKALYLYIFKKYNILNNMPVSSITEVIEQFVISKSLYCRENALQTICNTGITKCVLTVLNLIDNNNVYYHEKMLVDILLDFNGNKSELADCLWQHISEFSVKMQKCILDFTSYAGIINHSNDVLKLMKQSTDDELTFSAIRYFTKFPDIQAFEEFENMLADDTKRWEYKAIIANALGKYKGHIKKATRALNKLVESPIWQVRNNAARSLKQLYNNTDAYDEIYDGNDAYAKDILTYYIGAADKEYVGA